MRTLRLRNCCDVADVAINANTNLGLMADALMQLLFESGVVMSPDAQMDCRINASLDKRIAVNVSIAITGSADVENDDLVSIPFSV